MSSEDQEFASLTDRLGSALNDQADRFEPSNDAYARVAEAVSSTQQGPRSTAWLRPLAAAAAVVVTVGVGAMALSTQGSQSVGTGPGESQDSTASVIEDSTTTLAPSEEDLATQRGTDAESDGESGDADDAGPSTVPDPLAVIGPVRSTRLDAAQAFMDLLRLRFGAPEIVDGQVVIRSFDPGAVASPEGLIVATLSMVEVAGGYAVEEATTEFVTIDSIDQLTADSPMTVLGSGIGFEATLKVKLMSALDRRVLAATSATAGAFGEVEPYAAELAVVGAEQGWVVVSSLGGADGVTDPFAAKSVTFQTSEADPTDYAVIGVAPNDPDGGLVVRSGPGKSNDRVGVLPGGMSGLRRNNTPPVAVGDDIWWSVTGPDGVDGWVNSRFVASNEPVSDEALESLASDFVSFVPSDFEGALNNLPFTDRIPVLIGTIDSPIPESADRLLLAETWSEIRSIPMPEVYGEPRETSLHELMWTANWATAELQPGGTYSYQPDRRAAEIYFAGLSSIVIAPENPNSPWDRTFLFVESTPAGPEVVAMVVEVQQL